MEQLIISVLMTTYNPNFDYLKESLDSIYSQTYNNFEVILVDDGSEINVKQFLNENQYKNLHYIRLAKNQGITRALNIGLSYCRGKYIARMDDDDISLPNRFKLQVKYFENNPKTNILGCNKINFGENNNQSEIMINNLSRERQQVELFFSNIGVPHPSVMVRKSFLDEFNICYNEDYKKSQDYGLWVSCSKYSKIECLPETLLKYRCHKKQISSNSKEEQMFFKDKVRLDQLERLGIYASEDEKRLHLDFCADNVKKEQQNKMLKWIRKLYKYNEKTLYFDSKIFKYRLFVKGYTNLSDCNKFSRFIKIIYIFKFEFILYYLKRK
ncbi:glycosyltransferase [Thomasclavelia spiroformis]|uniref:glycosyltransferase n=1 Tax=Thomasclavelia spiroformis TaxID=29348 RepID=UPI0026DA981E|nr:glycosyltransferase [Thomasclavelia spiroformis]